MKELPLVSIISPCYNGENFVSRLLDSILLQTYKNIELFLINDGSKDDTELIVCEYINKFKENGMTLHYEYQDNAGQCTAINKGLKKFQGEYITWIDSDDFLKPQSVEKRVEILENNKEYGFCITHAEFVKEDNVNRAFTTYGRKKPKGKDDFFLDIIKGKNVMYSSGGGFMIRTESFLKVCPNREIYVSTEGQNWQLMLPIAYHYRCGYINEPLYVVVERAGSHSRAKRTTEKTIELYNESINILKHIVDEMKIPEADQIIKWMQKNNARKKIVLAMQENNEKLLESQFAFLQSLGQLEAVDKLMKWCSKTQSRKKWYFSACKAKDKVKWVLGGIAKRIKRSASARMYNIKTR